MLQARRKRHLRRIAHHLRPVVLIAERGATEAVIEETRRALSDHELIKVRIDAWDREARREIGRELAAACEAEPVQTIGKVLVLFKANPDANPALSNLALYGDSTD